METVHSQGAATVQIQGFPWVICRALLERELPHIHAHHTGGKERTGFTPLSIAFCTHTMACTHIHTQVHIIIIA